MGLRRVHLRQCLLRRQARRRFLTITPIAMPAAARHGRWENRRRTGVGVSLLHRAAESRLHRQGLANLERDPIARFRSKHVTDVDPERLAVNPVTAARGTQTILLGAIDARRPSFVPNGMSAFHARRMHVRDCRAAFGIRQTWNSRRSWQPRPQSDDVGRRLDVEMRRR